MLVAAALGALVNALQPTLEVGGGKASIGDVRDTLLAAFGDDTASGFDAWALGEGLDSGDTLLVADVQLFAEYAVEQGGLGLPGAGNAGEQDNGGSALGGGGMRPPEHRGRSSGAPSWKFGFSMKLRDRLPANRPWDLVVE